MLQPKRVKYRKMQKGSRRGKAHSGNVVVFGAFGLQALENSWITDRQIEAARRAITRHIHRGVMSGFAYFRTNQLPKNRRRRDREAERVLRITGLRWLKLAA